MLTNQTLGSSPLDDELDSIILKIDLIVQICWVSHNESSVTLSLLYILYKYVESILGT